jgi:hypothetical protein
MDVTTSVDVPVAMGTELVESDVLTGEPSLPEDEG